MKGQEMGWVIWRDEDNNAGETRRIYVRRITPNFVSFTINRADARSWPSRADARRALKGTGLSTYRVSDPDAPDPEPTPEPAPEPTDDAAPADDDGPPFT